MPASAARLPDTARALLTGASLEITSTEVDDLACCAELLTPGTRIHLTHLARDTVAGRVAAAAAIRGLGFEPVPHIAARRLRSERELTQLLDGLAAADASASLMVLGGDPPAPEGPYPDALALLAGDALSARGVREVAIAAYPDGHPAIAHDALSRALADKLAALAAARVDARILTQFSFDAAPVADWIARARDAGITAPVRIGIPGPTSARRLLAFARRFGVASSARIAAKYGLALTELLGTAGPDRFVSALAAALPAGADAGEVAVHLYTFGGVRAAAEWLREAAATF